MKKEIKLSALPHTWLIDLDGTVAVHNAYLKNGEDRIIDGAKKFLDKIPEKDTVIFLTSREEKYRETTVKFLKENNIKYNDIIFSLPYGERVLINDKKPGGLKTALAVNLERDKFEFDFEEDESL